VSYNNLVNRVNNKCKQSQTALIKNVMKLNNSVKNMDKEFNQ